MNQTALIRPTLASLGFALFLTINATSIWGGVFPFLPLEFQTPLVTISFYFSQALAFAGTFFLKMYATYQFPKAARRFLIVSSSGSIFLGYCCLVAALYLDTWVSTLVIVGGLLLGGGCAHLFIVWQRLFAALDADEGVLTLMLGMGLSPVFYFALYLIPVSVTTLIIPLLVLPFCSLFLILSHRKVDLSQPMFEDLPKEHTKVYFQTLRDYWRSALCVASLGLVSGAIRAIAIAEPSVGSTVNITSMVALAVISLIIIVVWSAHSFSFSVITMFRTVFPFILVSLLIMPFLGDWYVHFFAGIAYVVFSFATILMMLQCAQASRDRGVNPMFIFGFFGGLVFSLQGIGFILGYFSGGMEHFGFQQLSVVALLVMCVLSLTLFIAQGGIKARLLTRQSSRASTIEFIALPGQKPPKSTAAQNDNNNGNGNDAASLGIRAWGPREWQNLSSSAQEPDDAFLKDRISKQCLLLQRDYRLTAREGEIIELIARGNSVAHIAETLVVSENTIRTHNKRVYTKLNIHKRQELLNLINKY